MPYPNLTDCAMPYHLDGTVVKVIGPTGGVLKTLSDAEMLELNDEDLTAVTTPQENNEYIVFFFPEKRDISGLYAQFSVFYPGTPTGLQGSADSTNGLDGTWASATMPSGYNAVSADIDGWRKAIAPVEDMDNINVLRLQNNGNYPGMTKTFDGVYILHLYGKKHSGETADDILFLDAENSDAEFGTPLDFGDRPAGTSVIRQIKLKNNSSTLTASSMEVEVEDPADIIRVSLSSGGPWTTTVSIASIAAGAKSAIVYVKCETPAPPTPLGPDRAPIKATVGSWA
jgi:hypothetical protein